MLIFNLYPPQAAYSPHVAFASFATSVQTFLFFAEEFRRAPLRNLTFQMELVPPG